jgi:hypothetical protein
MLRWQAHLQIFFLKKKKLIKIKINKSKKKKKNLKKNRSGG